MLGIRSEGEINKAVSGLMQSWKKWITFQDRELGSFPGIIDIPTSFSSKDFIKEKYIMSKMKINQN